MGEDDTHREARDSQPGSAEGVGATCEMPAHSGPAEPTRDAAPHYPDDAIRSGAIIAGRYRLLQQVGEGGFGVVFLAEQQHPVRRKVAVKVIKLGMDTKQVVARFQAERQALAMLSHPNVAAVHDAGATETGRPFFVMEYVPGEPITAFCDRHNYTTRQRLELFTQACEAIQHAHQKAIIHRDVKPSNLLVTLKDDKPLLKVIDFGVAKATAQHLTEQTLFTEQGQLIGTPEYTSPEQAEMNALDVDTRTDIYSLGVVLYELLTGALPFDSKTLRRAAYEQVRRIIREQEPPRPSTRLSGLGDSAIQVAKHRQTQLATLERELRGDLEWIPLKALRKDRSQRYRTAAQLAEDVRNYLEDRPLTAGPESAAYRAKKFLRRNQRLAVTLAGVSVILVAATAVSSWQAVRARRAELETARQRDQALAESRRADEQAAIAQAVNDFLQNMLNAGAGYRRMGRNVTVLQAVRQAVINLDNGALDGKPVIEAAVRLSIGETLLSSGAPEEAEPNFAKSLALRRAVLPSDDPGIARCLVSLGGLYKDLHLFDKAEPLFREAIAIHRARRLQAEELEYSYTLTGFGWVLRGQRNFAEAERVDREALAIRRQLDAPVHIAHALGCLANDLDASGKLQEAEDVLREWLDIRRKLSPANALSPEPLLGLAAVLRKRGKFAEAERYYGELLAVAGDEKPLDRAAVLRSRGSVLRAQGRLDEAERDYRESFEIRLKELPKGDPLIAGSMASLASVLRDAGNMAAAAELMNGTGKQFVADFMKRREGLKDTAETAGTIVLLGSCFQSAGALDEALNLYLQALAIRRKVLYEYHPEVAAILTRISEVLDAKGDADAADDLWRTTLALRIENLKSGDGPAARADVYLSLVPSLMAAGHVQQAREFCAEALKLGPTNISYLNNVAWRLVTDGNTDHRDPALAAELAGRAAALAPDRGYVRNTLGVALYRAGDFRRAIDELKASVRLNAAEPVISDYLFLAMSYKRLANEQAAREWYDRAVAMKVGAAQSDELKAFRLEAEQTLGIATPAAAGADLLADAKALVAAGDYERAEPMLRQLRASVKGDTGAEARDLLIQCLLRRGERPQALEILKKRASDAHKGYRPGHVRFPRVTQYRLEYAHALADDGQFQPAVQVLTQAEEECPPELHGDVVAALAKVYDAWGRPGDASAWRARLPQTRPVRATPTTAPSTQLTARD